MKIKGDEVGGRPSKESAPNNGKLLLLLLPFVILTLNSVLFPPHHPGLEFMWFTVPSCIYISSRKLCTPFCGCLSSRISKLECVPRLHASVDNS